MNLSEIATIFCKRSHTAFYDLGITVKHLNSEKTLFNGSVREFVETVNFLLDGIYTVCTIERSEDDDSNVPIYNRAMIITVV